MTLYDTLIYIWLAHEQSAFENGSRMFRYFPSVHYAHYVGTAHSVIERDASCLLKEKTKRLVQKHHDGQKRAGIIESKIFHEAKRSETILLNFTFT